MAWDETVLALRARATLEEPGRRIMLSVARLTNLGLVAQMNFAHFHICKLLILVRLLVRRIPFFDFFPSLPSLDIDRALAPFPSLAAATVSVSTGALASAPLRSGVVLCSTHPTPTDRSAKFAPVQIQPVALHDSACTA